MAPKNKFTKEEMVAAALQVVRTKGIEGLTAKTMADALGTSTQPIFTAFGSMDIVRQEVCAAAVRVYDQYTNAGLQEKIPFFGEFTVRHPEGPNAELLWHCGPFAYSLKNDEQIAAAQKFIQDEVDYLLISAAGTSGWDSVLQDAQAAGIQVILFDRTIDADESLYVASIVSDMAKEGQTAVDWLASQNLETYNIIHIQGVMGSAAQIGRTGALDEQVAANDNWNMVTQQTAEWNAETAQQIVQSVIDSGKEFNVIYAENDDMAKGAVAALDKANISHGVGKDVIVMGFDCNKWALEELLAGNWNYDGQCNPFQASYIDAIIKDLQAGKAPAEKTIIMDEKGFDASTITQEDVDNYGI